MSSKVKAYKITDAESIYNYAIVCFAENAGQAKSYALDHECFNREWVEYTSLRAKRVPELDHMAQGRKFMDHENAEDMIALAKLGWTCNIDDLFGDECEPCPANQYCNYYQDVLAQTKEQDQ